jgi:hypothetical protein
MGAKLLDPCGGGDAVVLAAMGIVDLSAVDLDRLH